MLLTLQYCEKYHFDLVIFDLHCKSDFRFELVSSCLSNANSKPFLNYLGKILLSSRYLKTSDVKVMISRATIKIFSKFFTQLIFLLC